LIASCFESGAVVRIFSSGEVFIPSLILDPKVEEGLSSESISSTFSVISKGRQASLYKRAVARTSAFFRLREVCMSDIKSLRRVGVIIVPAGRRWSLSHSRFVEDFPAVVVVVVVAVVVFNFLTVVGIVSAEGISDPTGSTWW